MMCKQVYDKWNYHFILWSIFGITPRSQKLVEEAMMDALKAISDEEFAKKLAQDKKEIQGKEGT